LRRELRPTLKLALPLASAELAWMAMGVVDTIMVGPLGPAAIGAGSLGGIVFYAVAICATGVLYGIDTLVAQAHGAGDSTDARRSLVNGLWLAAMLAPIAAAGLLLSVPLLRAFGTNEKVHLQFERYITALAWSVAPVFFYAAFRRYLQSVHRVGSLTFAIISANLINFAGNWLLIYGHWGFPAMGVRGSAWSTCIARTYMMAVVGASALRGDGWAGVDWRPHWSRIRRLFGLGLPAALQMAAEAGVFALVTALASKLDEVATAAHAIALNVISVTYMAPLGISSAAAVRVGNAIGRGDRRGAAEAGWTALAVSSAVMGAAGVALFAVPEAIVRLYSSDAEVIQAGAAMLGVAAFFQLGDGAQVTATGALRGAGDTRTAMLANIAFYWAVGLPLGWWLCFRAGWGARGLWIGLCAALLLIGGVLLWAWRRRINRAP
jgi:MATE family multidrug resistance protein